MATLLVECTKNILISVVLNVSRTILEKLFKNENKNGLKMKARQFKMERVIFFLNMLE